MTPKEKAESLINSMELIFKPQLPYQKFRCMDAAILCVDEITNELNRINEHLQSFTTTIGYSPEDRIQYWNEVEKEIQKQ